MNSIIKFDRVNYLKLSKVFTRHLTKLFSTGCHFDSRAFLGSFIPLTWLECLSLKRVTYGPTSFPGSLSSASLVVGQAEERDPGNEVAYGRTVAFYIMYLASTVKILLRVCVDSRPIEKRTRKNRELVAVPGHLDVVSMRHLRSAGRLLAPEHASPHR